ncbi:TonB-dependent receptor [Neolewinella agarilytica]|uniref:Outer membrane receptor proteins, mostly Fe transport n=1 Tax=Neolewinella agarilytica TaxID=478744 RepID=A0A1H9AKI0_9BACT|nr:TonB-dependent receptor [Neolewinella agarilytica]SEP77322.1 Outer membrane receptor proteins, mostly Fe transport [Neolewinella agarilytica]
MILIQLLPKLHNSLTHSKIPALAFWLVLIIVGGQQIFAQAAEDFSAPDKTVIYGKVHDKKGEPLIGVSLQVEGTYDGTVTDLDGSFHFSTAATGGARLIVSMFGFENVERNLSLAGTDSVTVDIEFGKETLSLEQVVVSDVRQIHTTDKARTTQLNRVEALTTAVDGNVQSAFQTMAGVQPAATTSGLFIRGGSGRESQAFVDGMLVDNFNYSSPSNTAGSARFSANMFKGTFLSTGGFSAKYGQAISGALVLETTDIPNKSSADIGISPLFGEAGFEKVNRKGNFSVGATGKYQNLGLFLRLMPSRKSFTQYPVTYEGTANVKWAPVEGTLIKSFGSIGDSKIGIFDQNLDNPTISDHTQLKNKNVFWQSTISHELSNQWTLTGGMGYGKRFTNVHQFISEEDLLPIEAGEFIREENMLSQARINLNHRHKSQTFDLGAEIQHRRDLIDVEEFTGIFNDTYGAAFIERAGTLFGRLHGRAGLRVEYSDLLSQTNFAPRMNLNYILGSKEQLFASWGVYHQRPATQQLYLTGGNLNFERAKHFTFGYNRNENKRSFRAELYRKEYDQLVLFDTDLENPSYNNTGKGYARGLDVFYRDRSLNKGTDIWLTYSYLDSERRYSHYPVSAQPNFAAKHVGNIVVKHFFQKQMINLSSTYTIGSGRPYYNPNRPLGEFNSDRTKTYHNVNFNIAYLPKSKKSFSVIVLTVYNAFNFEQTLNYEYSANDFNIRRAIGPLTERYLFLGYFVNFGIDRTDDIINQQLN